MSEHGGGSIVNIGSGCNTLGFPKPVSYKAGIEMFTKPAAVELGAYGIRINCVAPEAIEVERTILENGGYAAIWGAITPLCRVGVPTDVGRAVVFLAGSDSSFVTGQTQWLYGGLFAQPQWPYPSSEMDRDAKLKSSLHASAEGMPA
jgi:3-oxoacyl-[acyl-carrier protein] reductase